MRYSLFLLEDKLIKMPINMIGIFIVITAASMKQISPAPEAPVRSPGKPASSEDGDWKEF